MRLMIALVILAIWAVPALADYDAAALYSAAHRGVSMVVILDGQVVYEDYPNGGSAEQPNPLASGTKSFSGIIAAAAVQDGLLDLDEQVSETLPGWVGTPREPITIRQLLNMTDGLGRRGRPARPAIYRAAVRAPFEHEAGTFFSYHSTSFQVFGEVMRRKLGGTSAVEYLNARVLSPYGIEVGGWRAGRDRNPMMASGAQMTGRDWALFGQLILDRAQLNGEPLVSPVAFEELFVGSEVNPAYGLGFWLVRPIDAAYAAETPPLSTGTDFWTNLEVFPSDMVMAAGAGDQRLYISWDRRMIVVRQAEGIVSSMMGRSLNWSDVDFWRMLEAAPGEAPADVMAEIPVGLVAARDAAGPRPAPTAPPVRRTLPASPGPQRQAEEITPPDPVLPSGPVARSENFVAPTIATTPPASSGAGTPDFTFIPEAAETPVGPSIEGPSLPLGPSIEGPSLPVGPSLEGPLPQGIVPQETAPQEIGPQEFGPQEIVPEETIAEDTPAEEPEEDTFIGPTF